MHDDMLILETGIQEVLALTSTGNTIFLWVENVVFGKKYPPFSGIFFVKPLGGGGGGRRSMHFKYSFLLTRNHLQVS